MARGHKTGGRQCGTPNRVTREIRDASRALLEDAAYIASLQRRLRAGKAPHMETLLHYYAYGKPRDTVEQVGSPQQLVIRIEKPWDDNVEPHASIHERQDEKRRS